jgi:pyrroline-5-carboxylate reductase
MTPTDLPSSLVLVGAGKMGGAMLQGWLALGLAPAAVSVLDPFAAQDMIDLCAGGGVVLNPPLASLGPPQVLVLAIKPQMLDQAAPDIAPSTASAIRLFFIPSSPS